jgi:hypothetical protein
MISLETLEKLLRISDTNNNKKKKVSMQLRRNQSGSMFLSYGVQLYCGKHALQKFGETQYRQTLRGVLANNVTATSSQ